MIRRGRHSLLALGLASAVLLLAACGAGGSGAPSSDDNAAPTVAKDDSLAKMVPSNIASSGKLTFGTNATYPPNEFTDTDGQTIIGMDVDIAKAVAQKLGLTAEFQNSTFNAILLGVGADRYNAGISSFTINAERIKSVDMISYFNVGTKAAVVKGNPDKISLDDLCGKSVGVELDTIQVDDIAARSKKCQAEGKPAVAVTALQDQTDVTLALTSKRIVVLLADAPVVNYAIKQTNGQFEHLGDQYAAAPEGIALKKGQGDFPKAVQGAVQSLITDGTYGKILKKWDATDGAITTAEINPTTGQ